MRSRWLRLLLMLLLSQWAWARLGGGNTYSGSSTSSSGSSWSSSSSSGSGGDADLIFFILELLIRYPQVGVPVALIAFGFYAFNRVSTSVSGGESRQVYRSSPVELPDSDAFHVKPQQESSLDPNFSYYVFRDFVGLLYTQVQILRPTSLAQVGHYLDARLAQKLHDDTLAQGVTAVKDVVVGAARILGQTLIQQRTRLTLTLETNYTEVLKDGQEARSYSKERWIFQRKPGVLSPGPTAVGDQRLGCPNCGQSGEVGPDGRCPYCDKVVNGGDYGWVVVSIQVQDRETKLALGIGGDAPEVGTQAPTRRHPMLAQRYRTFRARYREFSEDVFKQRVQEIFQALQLAWSDQQWELARPYETDSLYNTHRYWIEAYRSQAIVNRLSQIECQQIHLSNVDTDPFFDAITVHIIASMIDVTVDKASGKVLSGDPKRPRRFTEYWTFIRKVGYTPPTEVRPVGTCPSCGGPLDQISQAGQCQYCGSIITKGDFDWVLAQIEQDESYRVG